MSRFEVCFFNDMGFSCKKVVQANNQRHAAFLISNGGKVKIKSIKLVH